MPLKPRLANVIAGVLGATLPLAAAAPTLTAFAERVPVYGRIDFAIEPGPLDGDPYDPAEVEVTLEIRAPDGELLELSGFLMQPFAPSREPGLPLERRSPPPRPQGGPVWRARFAPLLPGRHRIVARCRDRNGVRPPSQEIVFEAEPPVGHGYVRVSPDDPRFFAFDDGTPFFIVGQNLAFIGRQQRVHPDNLHDQLARLANAGVNYVRVWACCGDWALCIEPRRGDYRQTDCHLLDEIVSTAERVGIRLQLCLLTRNLYMEDLKDPRSPAYDRAVRDARNVLRYVVARWGYSTAVAAWEYWNEQDPGLPTARFYREVGSYLDRIDVHRHLRTTSAWGPAPADWTHGHLDVANLHGYMRPNGDFPWQDAVAAVENRVSLLRKHAPGKPALLSEFGLGDDRWRLSPMMSKDIGLLHLHDSLWASALSGLSGTTMFWWWEQLDKQNAAPHYAPVAAFTAQIPFTKGGLEPRAFSALEGRVRTLALQGSDCIYAWLADRQASWWRCVGEGVEPRPVEDAVLALNGLADGAYEIEWWDTTTGQPRHRERAVVSNSRLHLHAPSFLRDIALKAARANPQE